MLVGGVERCARCGTMLRGGRTVCPSCGLDQAAANESLAAAAPMTQADSGPAPSKKSICPTCMTSVMADTMVEYAGQRLCPACYETMKGKQERRKAEG